MLEYYCGVCVCATMVPACNWTVLLSSKKGIVYTEAGIRELGFLLVFNAHARYDALNISPTYK